MPQAETVAEAATAEPEGLQRADSTAEQAARLAFRERRASEPEPESEYPLAVTVEPVAQAGSEARVPAGRAKLETPS